MKSEILVFLGWVGKTRLHGVGVRQFGFMKSLFFKVIIVIYQRMTIM